MGVLMRRSRAAVIGGALAMAVVGLSGPAALATPSEREAAASEVAAPLVKAQISAGQSATDLTGSLTADDLVASLVGEGLTYSNVEYSGSDLGAGTVSGVGDLGLGEGVALSSGAVAGESSSILGPNNNSSQTTDLGSGGDADLDAIIAPLQTEDASVLEFDFVPVTDQITFAYVFGSEEYNEYVNSNFNDVFGFFVNGTNCAVTSDGDRITVNTINNGSHADLFNDNTEEAGTPFDTQLDGFTTTLTCAAAVNPDVSNHVKLAIADTSDKRLDSAVVIGAGTFKSNHAPVAEDGAFTTPLDTAVATPLQASDPDGDDLSYTVIDDVEHGTLSGTGADLTFTPDEGFTGTTSFTFSANDGAADSNVATVTITVEPKAPTEEPTEEPTDEPTDEPTGEPTTDPTDEPTEVANPGGDLPRTGVDVGLTMGAAGLLLVVGGAVMLLARRNRRS